METILKQKVRSNYKIFLHANDEINRVGKEMIDLNQLINHTHGVIQDISTNRQKEKLNYNTQNTNSSSLISNSTEKSSKNMLKIKENVNKKHENNNESSSFLSLAEKYGDISSSVNAYNNNTANNDNTDSNPFNDRSNNGNTDNVLISSIPAEIRKGPDKLIRLVVEQQYPTAVILVVQLEKYFNEITIDKGN